MSSSPRRGHGEQELSIKDREDELYATVGPAGATEPVRPFHEYLRHTPAQPISTGVKALFWAVGAVVVLLFVLAIWRVQRPSRPATRRAATVLVPPAAGGLLRRA